MTLTARQRIMKRSSSIKEVSDFPSTTQQKTGRFRFLRGGHNQFKGSSQKENSTSNEVEVPLLRLEEKCYALNGAPVSTLTWFEGDHEAAAFLLQEKMREILSTNPWLAGHIEKRNGKPCLIHPETYNNDLGDTDVDDSSSSSSSSDDEESLLKQSSANNSTCPPNLVHITNHKDTKLHRYVPMEQTADLCKKFLVQNSLKQLVWKVAIVPCSMAPQNYFAVVDSMSHVVSDGHTYYNIHNMLCAKAPIQKLQAGRIFSTVELQKEAIGQEEYGLFDSAGFLTGLICGVIKSTILAPVKLAPKIKKRYFLIDNDKVKAEKAAAVTNDIPFVSTNDVLTSWLFQQTKCSYGLMVMNFRSRLEGHTEILAGNYENSLFYYPDDFSSPGLIRKSLTANPSSWKRSVTHATTTTPTIGKHVKGHFSMVSNWASFAQNSDLPDCQEKLHMPLFVRGKHPLPNNISVGIIFRVGPGKTAIYVVGNSKVMRRLEDAKFESDSHLQ